MIDLLKYKEDGVEEESSFATFADGNGNIRNLVDCPIPPIIANAGQMAA